MQLAAGNWELATGNWQIFLGGTTAVRIEAIIRYLIPDGIKYRMKILSELNEPTK